MLKALYIGILSKGTTSRMRSDALVVLTPDINWHFMDTDIPFKNATRISRSMAFRWQIGSLVREINKQVLSASIGGPYRLIWVDKGIYLYPETVRHLADISECLVHYTPDTAFFANRSRLFNSSAYLYDLLVTTKSFDLKDYYRRVDSEKVYLITQAFDSNLHCKPPEGFKKNGSVVFIGLCEADREDCVKSLLSAGLNVRVGGKGWEKFVSKHKKYQNLHYLGDGVFGKDYATELAGASIGLGLLTKRFPELHTTRTFEIPACGTAIATERTIDTSKIFSQSEAIFFSSHGELTTKLVGLLKNPKRVKDISEKGYIRVQKGKYDYSSVLRAVLKKVSII